MLRLILFLILLLLIGVMALAAVAFKTWGITGFLGVVLGLVILVMVVKRLAGFALRAAFTAPFKMKGQVLSGATAVVHSVEPSEAPVYPVEEDEESDGEIEEDDGEEDEPSPSEWYRVDVTITPQTQATPFQLWEPGELVLAKPGSDAMDDDDTGSQVAEVELWRDGAWIADEEGKYPGEQRLRLLVGVTPGAERLCFRYYFESFGEVRFPKPLAGVASGEPA